MTSKFVIFCYNPYLYWVSDRQVNDIQPKKIIFSLLKQKIPMFSLNPDYAIGLYYNSQLLQTQAFTWFVWLQRNILCFQSKNQHENLLFCICEYNNESIA